MHRKFLFLTLFVLVFAICYANSSTLITTAAPDGGSSTNTFLPLIFVPREFESIPTNATFDNVTDITHAGDERLFVAERAGTIKILHPNGTSSLFLDIRDRVLDSGAEQGFFGLAFHPDYATNGYFYVTYTAVFNQDPNKAILRLSQFQVTSNPDVADPNSEAVLVSIVQDFVIHNGGSLEFNPVDGRLYMGVGDDSQNMSAQDDSSSKGKILRINVDTGLAARGAVMHPLNEDTMASTAVSVERWAKGVRNPWRMAVDPVSGNVYIGDVGDRSWEEIDVIPLGVSGRNFGWPCVEGPEVLFTDGDCNKTFDPPIYFYDIGCAIVVGEYWRFEGDLGRKGSLIFTDGCLRQVQSLSNSGGSWQATTIGDLSDAPGGFLTAFGQDVNGTVYAGVLGTSMPLLELYIPPQ